MFRLFSIVLLLSFASFGSSAIINYIRFVNAVDGRNITVQTSVQGVPTYYLPFTGLTDYIPISTNGTTSVTFSINGTSLTATPLSLPLYTSVYTLIVVLLDHNNVLNLIPYNETLAATMLDNVSVDGTMPARSWIRLIGLNHIDNTYLVSLNNTDTNTNIFSHVAYLEITPYVEIPSNTHGLLAYLSTDSSVNWTITPNFANSTAYTIFYFSSGVTISTDRYVPYSILGMTTNAAANGNDNSSSGSDNGSSSGSPSNGSSSSGSDSSSSGSPSASTSSPLSVINGDSTTSSASKIVFGLASIAVALLIL